MGLINKVKNTQVEICEKYNASFYCSPNDSKLGIAQNAIKGMLPLNGLRHPDESGTNGWYIWAGEDLSEDPDFFHPLHVEHLSDYCPQVIPYLGLPPGWRFLISTDYEDVWFDETLLDVD